MSFLFFRGKEEAEQETNVKADVKQNSQCRLLSGWFLGRLICDSEAEYDMFLRNVGQLSTDITVLYPRRQKYS
jgi:hypothetical protein